MPRYFVAVKGFLDRTAFIRFDGKQAFIVLKDGSEIKARIRLNQAERSVRHKAWKEVAEVTALALIDATNPTQTHVSQSLMEQNTKTQYNPQYSKDLQRNRAVVASNMDATSVEDTSLTEVKISNV